MLGNDVQLLNAPYPIFCNPSFNTGALKYIYIYIDDIPKQYSIPIALLSYASAVSVITDYHQQRNGNGEGTLEENCSPQ